MQEAVEKKHRDHLWRYIIFAFVVGVITILSLLTYQNFGLLKAELSGLVRSVNSLDVSDKLADEGIIKTDKEGSGTKEDKEVESNILHVANVQPAIVMHLEFDDAINSTSFIDSSSNGNSAACNSRISCPTLEVSGKVNKAIIFDGVDDYLSIPVNNSLKPSDKFTVSMWIHPHSVAKDQTWQTILMNKFNHAIRLMPNGKIRGEIYNQTLNQSVYIYSRTGAVDYDAWNQIVMTYDGSQIRLYINGVLLSEVASVGTLNVSDNSPIYIGKYTNTQHYNGAVDNLLLYNGALSQAGVAEEYNKYKDTSQNSNDSNTTTHPASGTNETSKSTDGSNIQKINPNPNRVKGDLNADGQLSMMDVVTLFKRINDNKTLITPEFIKLTDMNNDGILNMIDVIILFKKVSNNI